MNRAVHDMALAMVRELEGLTRVLTCDAASSGPILLQSVAGNA